jgi:thioesterase domain-containing protein
MTELITELSEMSDFLPAAQALIQRIYKEIPLTAAMQLAVKSFDGVTLVLAVPLAANINDKGTGFAGSITALGSIAGWCALTLWGEHEIGSCQIAIYDAHFSFRKPLQGDFTATVCLPALDAREALQAVITQKGKGKITLRISLADASGEAAFLNGAYAVWRT